MRYYTDSEFKAKYVLPQPYKPFQQNREGLALIKLAKEMGVQIQKAPGSRCAKIKPGCLGQINVYPEWLLILFHKDSLNESGKKLKSGRPLTDEEKGANDDNI